MTTVSNLNVSIKEGSMINDVTVYYNVCHSGNKDHDERIFVETVTLQNDNSNIDYQLIANSDHFLTNLRSDDQRALADTEEKTMSVDDPKIIWVKQPRDIFERFKVDIIIQLTNLIILLLYGI